MIPMRLAGEPAMLHETRAALAATGLKLQDIEVGRIREVDVAGYRPAFETGAELGARCVIGSVWAMDYMFVLDCLGRMCDSAGKTGLSISLEFVTWSSVRNLQQALELLRGVKKDNLGLLIGALHFDRFPCKSRRT